TLAAYSVTRTDRAQGGAATGLMRDQVLPWEGGIWTPWRHLPLHIPLSVVSPDLFRGADRPARSQAPGRRKRIRERASTAPFGRTVRALRCPTRTLEEPAIASPRGPVRAASRGVRAACTQGRKSCADTPDRRSPPGRKPWRCRTETRVCARGPGA